MFYGKNHWRNNKSRDVFIEHFPNVWKVIEFEKRYDYTALPIKLQKLEADLIIYTVIDRILSEIPNIPIYTIHDSILTISEYTEYVAQVIEDESVIKYGIKPKLKIEYY
jgi:hypothetical protein